jgi:hypothetical protein
LEAVRFQDLAFAIGKQLESNYAKCEDVQPYSIPNSQNAGMFGKKNAGNLISVKMSFFRCNM